MRDLIDLLVNPRHLCSSSAWRTALSVAAIYQKSKYQ
jgi:hypothetical protein